MTTPNLHRDCTIASNRSTPRIAPPGPLSADSTIELVWRGSVLQEFVWGRFDAFGTASYWADQATRTTPQEIEASPLIETVAFCVLGGYGITYEMNCAAFDHLKAQGLLNIDPVAGADEIEAALRSPVNLQGRRAVHYRFPRQRSRRIAESFTRLAHLEVPNDDVELRDALDGFHGIGPKTASWIVRNHLGSDAVAIIDIHLRRAGVAAGFFDERWQLPRDYPRFEAAFLGYAECAQIRASHLDLVIWEQWRTYSRLRLKTRHTYH